MSADCVLADIRQVACCEYFNTDVFSHHNMSSFQQQFVDDHITAEARFFMLMNHKHLLFLQPTCCTVVQPLHRRQTGFSSFRRQSLEQSSITLTSAPPLAIFRQRLKTFLFHLYVSSGLNLLIFSSPCFIVDLVIILLFRPQQ